jgi:hypothetical protein
MGLRERLGGGDDSKNEYTVVARRPSGTGAPRPDSVDDGDWRWPSSPPNKDHFLYEWGEDLNEEFRYFCVEIKDSGYDFEEPEWVIEPDGGSNPAAEAAGAVYKKVEELEEKVDGPGGGGHNLSDVDSEEVLQARLKGIVAERGLEVAENTDDVIRILDSIGSSKESVGHPMIDMMTDAQNNLEIDSPMDLAMMMAMPELKNMMQSGQQVLNNVQQMTGGGQSAGASMAQQFMGGGQQQQQTHQQPKAQPSQTHQQPKAQPGAQTPAQSQPGQSSTPSQTQSGGSFSMDDMVEDGEDQEDTDPEAGVPGEDDSPMSATPEDVDSEPEPETNEESTSPLDQAESASDDDLDDEDVNEDEATEDEQPDEDETTDEPEVTA